MNPPLIRGIGAPSAVPTPSTDSVYPEARKSRAARSAAGEKPPSVISRISPTAAPACWSSALPLLIAAVG